MHPEEVDGEDKIVEVDTCSASEEDAELAQE